VYELNEMGESLFDFSMKLFSEAAHTNSSYPIFINHSAERFVFFDNKETILSKAQISSLKDFKNVSYLFELGDNVFDEKNHQTVRFYSMELKTITSFRSQTAYDVHMLLHPLIGCEATVILFKFNDNVMLSLAGYGEACILSDWYSAENDYNDLLERIHIVNVSLRSTREFFYDLIYSVARKYYIYPVSREMATYALCPIDYFLRNGFEFADRKELKQIINDALNTYRYEYGDDYVEQGHNISSSSIKFSPEFDLMLLDMERTEENPFGEEMEESDDAFKDDRFEEKREDVPELAEYEFDDVDPEIFRDPTLMVKWIEKHSSDKNETQKNDE